MKNRIISRYINDLKTYRVDFDLLLTVLLLYLYRTSIPFFKYPFIALFLYMSISSLVIFRSKKNHLLCNFFVDFRQAFLLFIILIISFFISSKTFLTIFKDIINATILICLFYMISLYVNTAVDLKRFIERMLYLITLFTLVITIHELLFYFNVFPSQDLLNTEQIASNHITELDKTDYNFTILFILFGIITILYLMLNTNRFIKILGYNLVLFISSVAIFFSGSRRGLFLLISVFTILLVLQLFRFHKKNSILKKIAKKTIIFIISFFVFLIVITNVVSHTSYFTKNKILEFLGSKNINETRIGIANTFYRYSLIFNKKSSYREIYTYLWTPVFDPKDPDSTWGLRIHKTVFPLLGDNAEIVPKGAKGYLMDHTCNSNSWNNIAYSYTQLLNRNMSNSDTLMASVYCYVSEDFNGEWVSLYCDGTAVGVFQAEYDMQKKGKWQKLELKVGCNVGEIFVQLFFSKKMVTDFSELSGYVVFAYPQISINRKSINILSSAHYNSYYDNQFHPNFYKNEISRTILSTDNHKYDYLSGFSGKYKSTVKDTFTSINFSGFFCLNDFKNHSLVENDQYDPVRRFVALLVREDTSYYGYKSNFLMEIDTPSYIDLRLKRWIFAVHIFTKEYNWKQRIFGGGFNFLNWYGYNFLKDKTASDTPHNPFLSVLLYSGILGLIIYCFFIYKVFYYYIKYVKEYPLIFIFFLITFFFTFFSGGSPFDPPIMGFFVILPFFIHSIHKKEEKALKESTLMNDGGAEELKSGGI